MLKKKKKTMRGNSLAVQRLGLCTLSAKGPGSIPGWGTKIPQATKQGQKKKKKHQLTPARMACFKKKRDALSRMWENRTLVRFWWDCKLVQPVWKTVWVSSKNKRTTL